MEKMKSTGKRKPSRRAGGKALATTTARSKSAASAKAGQTARASVNPNDGLTASPAATATSAACKTAVVTARPAAIESAAAPVSPPTPESPATSEPAAATVSPTATVIPLVVHTAVSEAKNRKIHLESSLEIKDVEDVHKTLLATLATGTAVTVDIGRVGAVDTAGVQLLVAFQSEAAKRGVSLEFCGESPALTHALTVLGLGTAIQIVTAHD